MTSSEMFRAADAAHHAAVNHPGGRLTEWYRLMNRNRYTIDPRRPEPDEADDAKLALYVARAKAIEAFVDYEVGNESTACYAWNWPRRFR